MRKILLTVAFILLAATAASAQAVVTNPASTRIRWDHDLTHLTASADSGFKLYVDDSGNGAVLTWAQETAPLGGSAAFPVLSIGLHTMQVTAFNEFVESDKSNILQVRIVVISAPSNLRLVARLFGSDKGKGQAIVVGINKGSGWEPTLHRIAIG